MIAFVGGLDLTNGRWDTPSHELFSTITNEHKGDFSQNYATGVSENYGPREPWHDIHMKLEGPIASDILQNFIERWRKQGLPKEYPDFPMDESVRSLIENTSNSSTDVELDETHRWTCQFYRSITSDSAIFDPSNPSLCFSENKKTEMSILQAYIHLIRKAQNFIYIENQYFYGSSHMWDMNLSYGTKPCCQHLIPYEIARKIANKIRKDEKFVAYIVVPMFPEGDPTSRAMQEILYYQRKTMEMMYETISNALQETGSTAEPTDYLFFMCPAKREKKGPHMHHLATPGEADKIAHNLRETMRCPIYVHSKMMITDDVHVIAGSANINQRSMDGTRDTEIAVGCWQEEYGLDNPYGDVSKFRKSLFTEHFVGWRNEFENPSSLECIKKVKQLSMENWKNYIGPRGSVMKGHMLPYPVHVRKDGKLSELFGTNGTFPDFGGKIAGKRIPLNVIKSHQKVLT